MKQVSLINNSSMQSRSNKQDEIRLLHATIILSVVLGLLYPVYLPKVFQYKSFFEKNKSAITSSLKPKSKIYPVLIEQKDFKKPVFKDQYRALSEFNTDGAGGITTEYGFHTLSNTDIFTQGNNANSRSPGVSSSTKDKKRGDEKTSTNLKNNKSNSRGTTGKGGILQKIPTNYRFKQHMALRYDGNSLTVVATQSMPGAAYFRSMIRQIRSTFAPPGLNYIIRDPYGYRLNQAINPQIVSVQFAINRDGLVTDVKVVSSIGQRKVDRACVDVLSNRNFGKPPPEIFRYGNIFGINFVFPDLRRFR